MNRCDVCGKFRPWADLVFKWMWDRNSEYPDAVEWFECAPDKGHNQEKVA